MDSPGHKVWSSAWGADKGESEGRVLCSFFFPYSSRQNVEPYEWKIRLTKKKKKKKIEFLDPSPFFFFEYPLPTSNISESTSFSRVFS